MNRFALWCVAAVAVAAVSPRAATADVIYDDFEDGVIDTSLWTPHTTYANSAVRERGGRMELVSRGMLTTARQYNRAEVGDVTVSGRLTLLDMDDGEEQLEWFTFVLRGSGVPQTGGYREVTEGLKLRLIALGNPAY